MTIRAVVFDWGGVIQRTRSHMPRQRLDDELGLPRGGVERAVFESAVWEQASTGRCSADDAWEAIATSLRVAPDDLDEFVRRFFAGDRVDDEIVALIRRLRGRGVPVGLLSNAPPGRTRGTVAARWGMEGLFDVQVFSYEVGVLKPDARMYRAVLAALDVPAEDALFIDDSPANVRGALDVGMAAVLFTGTEALRGDLARYGLLPEESPEH
ncbi:MAG TPA: HAD family phosphatase [Chloroflexi bacterium]|jgi:HAD superfamily hydrolase (TIGR01509 family)|nr:HAD family phosphatase [Chloroflexota bacterium]